MPLKTKGVGKTEGVESLSLLKRDLKENPDFLLD